MSDAGTYAPYTPAQMYDTEGECGVISSNELEYCRFTPTATSNTESAAIQVTTSIVRVIHAKLGPSLVRLSAPLLDLVAEGKDEAEAWELFWSQLNLWGDSLPLLLDVGPLRPEEIRDALNAPEDEDWSGLVGDIEGW